MRKRRAIALIGAGAAVAAATIAVAVTHTSPSAYEQAIAYTKTRPAFTPTRTVDVSSAGALKSAIANLRPGDLVKASTGFTVSSGSTDPLIIANRLSAPAVIDLTNVKIVYTGTGEYADAWIRNTQNVRIYGGDLSMAQPTGGGGSCIAWTGSQHTLWWGFKAHDCGSGGMEIFTAGPSYSYHGPVSHDDIQGEIGHFSLNHGRFDPHAEKCTGLHGANLSDNNWYPFDHNRIALYVHDSPCTGGGIEFGSAKSPTTSPPGPIPTTNTIYLKCVNLTFVSTAQAGGNCYQAWGYGMLYTKIEYLEARNITGHAYWTGGLYSKSTFGKTALATNTLDLGRASNTNLNPRYRTQAIWDETGGTVFRDLTPAVTTGLRARPARRR